HRTPQFGAVLAEVQEGLRELFGTAQDVLVLAASGTGAMEGSVTNLRSPGEQGVVVNGGKFGERWTKICQAYGLTVREVVVEWGRAVRPEAVKAALDEHPRVRALFVQASETSTCALHPVPALAEITRRRDVLLVVDGITAVGVIDLPMDRLGIDVLVTGSQKALMLPPGLAFVALSARARVAEPGGHRRHAARGPRRHGALPLPARPHARHLRRRPGQAEGQDHPPGAPRLRGRVRRGDGRGGARAGPPSLRRPGRARP